MKYSIVYSLTRCRLFITTPVQKKWIFYIYFIKHESVIFSLFLFFLIFPDVTEHMESFSLLCCLRYKKLVASTLVFPRQKGLLCGVRTSGSVTQPLFSQENMAPASLPSVGRVCCVWRETEWEKKREHFYSELRKEPPHIRSVIRGEVGGFPVQASGDRTELRPEALHCGFHW